MVMALPYTEEAYALLHDGARALALVEHQGIRVDTVYLKKSIRRTKRIIGHLEESLKTSEVMTEWVKLYGRETNIDSGEQLGKVLFEAMKFEPPALTVTGRPKTDEKALRTIKHPFVQDYLEIKKLKKAMSTYLYGILREVQDGVLHPFFNLHTAVTYRSSSDSPNFQNFPVRNKMIGKLIRSAFIPRPGNRLVELDYGGIEVCIAACYHKDPNMISYIKDKTKDMHRDMAMECFLLEQSQMNKEIRYCNPVESPIWMYDLSFKPIGEIKVGDEVMGWHRPGNGVNRGVKGDRRNRKRFTKATVVAVHRRTAPVVKVTMESGRIIRCTADHQWLRGDLQFRGEDQFHSVEPGRVLAKVVTPPKPLTNHNLIRKAGWLGGMMDGEGTWPGISQSLTHNPVVSAALRETADQLSFAYAVPSETWKTWSGILLKSDLDSAVRFLHWCRPFKKERIERAIYKRSSFIKQDKILSVEPDGEEEVVGMTTTTGNYIAWGYASKNCGKNMFVFPQFYGDWYIDCARSLWNALDSMSLVTADGTPLREHLTRKGISELGALNPKEETRPGTFEHHIKKVERRFWEKRFPTYAKWKNTWYDQYKKQGWFLTKTGFICQGYMKRNEAINYPVQGSAFHCLLRSLIRMVLFEITRAKMQSRIVGQIHDSIVCDVPDNELQDFLVLAQHVMVDKLVRHWDWINVPLEVEAEVTPVDGNWNMKEKMEIVT